MARVGSPDIVFTFSNAKSNMVEEEYPWNYSYNDYSLPGNECYYSPEFDAIAGEGSVEPLLGSSLPCSITTNLNGVLPLGMNDVPSFDGLDCSLMRCEALEASPSISGGEPRQEKDGGKCQSDLHAINREKQNDRKHCLFGKVGVGNSKGKKNDHGLPAKNLMAERRRRKKLNDRLFMLRSVVPNISKMDRTSTLGDAVEYLKKLLQRINELHNKPVQSSNNPCLPGSSKFQPLTYMHPGFLCKEMEDYHLSVPYPDAQPTKVGVRTTDGKALNIRMLCSRKPGLLLYTMRALDALGLDVKQAVVSCFNGFALNVFQAEQTMGKNITAEEIKSVMLHTAGYQASLYK